MRVDPRDRDAWVDRALGLGALPEDDAELPRGCVPYLPCSVDAILSVVERAAVTREDVFVDVGSGLGRAMMMVHLLTGAEAIGLEIQAGLVERARSIAEALRLDRVSTLHGDAERLVHAVERGSVFFFYCPFSGERLARVLDGFRPLALARPLRLCFVDTPPPELPWMVRDPAPRADREPIIICRTTPSRH